LGMSSSQVTFIFFRGAAETTNQKPLKWMITGAYTLMDWTPVLIIFMKICLQVTICELPVKVSWIWMQIFWRWTPFGSRMLSVLPLAVLAFVDHIGSYWHHPKELKHGNGKSTTFWWLCHEPSFIIIYRGSHCHATAGCTNLTPIRGGLWKGPCPAPTNWLVKQKTPCRQIQ
jgi:hypothetical protein